MFTLHYLSSRVSLRGMILKITNSFVVNLKLFVGSYLSKMIDCLFHNVSSYDPVALDCRYPIMGQSNLASGNDLTIIFCLTFLPNFLPCILFTIKSRSTTFIFLFSCFRDYQSIMFTVSF